MQIKIYGADWCADCTVVKNFLASKNIKFEYVIITDDIQSINFVEENNFGKRIIPTIVINNEVYTNPGLFKLNQIIEKIKNSV